MSFFEENQKKVDELIKVYEGDDDDFACLKETREYINQLAYNIGRAINPLNEFVVPFAVYALECYADELKKGDEEYVNTVVKELNKILGTAVVIIPGKRREADV